MHNVFNRHDTCVIYDITKRVTHSIHWMHSVGKSSMKTIDLHNEYSINLASFLLNYMYIHLIKVFK